MSRAWDDARAVHPSVGGSVGDEAEAWLAGQNRLLADQASAFDYGVEHRDSPRSRVILRREGLPAEQEAVRSRLGHDTWARWVRDGMEAL